MSYQLCRARGEVAVTPLHPLCIRSLFFPLLPFHGECVETEPSHETITGTFLVWRLFPWSFSTFHSVKQSPFCPRCFWLRWSETCIFVSTALQMSTVFTGLEVGNKTRGYIGVLVRTIRRERNDCGSWEALLTRRFLWHLGRVEYLHWLATLGDLRSHVADEPGVTTRLQEASGS